MSQSSQVQNTIMSRSKIRGRHITAVSIAALVYCLYFVGSILLNGALVKYAGVIFENIKAVNMRRPYMTYAILLLNEMIFSSSVNYEAEIVRFSGFIRAIEADIHLSLIHISEPTRPLYISYAVFCLKKKK
eukprot:TRINITY_DN18286_c0_g1_i1.p2 TRINITY_DN18286_c0_g1~~TRINITY_DN18286_c0_g1_i1.p2  ORF type:complete len:131 (+),score=29.03 TRINITY_DN18286_c0_g1_i1:220-612(+)